MDIVLNTGKLVIFSNLIKLFGDEGKSNLLTMGKTLRIFVLDQIKSSDFKSKLKIILCQDFVKYVPSILNHIETKKIIECSIKLFGGEWKVNLVTMCGTSYKKPCFKISHFNLRT